ncbi:MAG: UDP-N-acetylmuramoyl-L-alanyl-D-glutamate--2,6-diaminopimelate ligase [Endozoicomonadaceae bacterium]|nr:UDP-N-acetylmuramoyl-L-alanyl-D-glutamate--2,6-diaminopimelate ligase [Endozoicomonadaceae bacterium]
MNQYSLNKLLQQLNINDPDCAVNYTGITTDSRKVKPGDLFIATPGVTSDGRQFISQAIKQGAVAVLAEQDETFSENKKYNNVTVYAIKNLHLSTGSLLNQWFDYASEQLTVVGITGTNGKTSCCFFLAQILQYTGIKTGVVGTVGTGIYPQLLPSQNTTPGIFDLHEILFRWNKQQIPWTVMEVSSHALTQRRVDGVAFDIALFTNISRDHLDFHGSMNNYVQAKAQLFCQPDLKYAIINQDDKYSDVMISNISKKTACITYSLNNKNADIYLQRKQCTHNYTEVLIKTPWGCGEFKTQLFGRFNLYNLAGVIGVLGCADFALHTILSAIEKINYVPGRMTVYGGNNQPLVLVDYAHTPDALSNALLAIKEHHNGKIICIFGCGGDRDRGKRPLMMKAALEYADQVVLTSDNPRFEDPLSIIDDALAAVPPHKKGQIAIIPDRKQAINQTIRNTQKNVAILVAGKGHENYQEIAGIKYHLDDGEIVENALMCNN